MKLLKQPFKVTDTIKKLSPGSDNSARNERRYFISAVFYVLPLEYRQRPNPYNVLLNTSRPVDLPGGKDWNINKKQYLKNKEKE